MFYSDNPIEKKEQDRLNRADFSYQLAKAILAYSKLDNFTVSICGKWGSGKTSVLNMVVNEIENLTYKKDADEKPIIIRFNPWNYSDCSQLLSQFFATLKEGVETNKASERLQKVGAVLKKYSSLLDYTAYIPVVGQYLAPVREVASNAGEHIQEKADEMSSLTAQREILIKALSEQKQKLIVIIDDIDRLNNQQIRLVFQLVNSLAGFPNMIYLLSFDREVVARALSTEQNCNGEEYLEKIVQVLFEIPMVSKQKIRNLFAQMFSNIISNEYELDGNFEKDYWDLVFSSCISPFLNNIRDVKRIINAFEFKYNFMREEVNCIDLVALTTLQICVPEMYAWIYRNREILTGTVINGISGVEQQQNKAKYLKTFSSICPGKEGAILEGFSYLFPKFSWTVGGYSRTSSSEEELKRKQRIASPNRFDRFFELSLEEITFNQKLLQESINYKQEQMKCFMDELTNTNSLTEYLDEISAYIPDMTDESQLIFVDELLRMQTFDKNYKQESFLAPVSAYRCCSTIKRIFQHNMSKKAGVHKNSVILKNMIEKTSFEILSPISEIIYDIETAYAKIGGHEDNSRQYITEEDLSVLEDILLKKIKEIMKTKCVFDVRNYDEVIWIWKYLDAKGFKSHLENILSDDVNVPKYLYWCLDKWRSKKKYGWEFKEERIADFFTEDEVYQKILKLKNTSGFSSLKQEFKEVAVAFSQYYMIQKKDKDFEVSNLSVAVELPSWEE